MPSDVAIDPYLRDYDVLGSRGSFPHAQRVNILASLEKVTLKESILVLEVTQFAAEGFGLEEFWADSVFVPPDQPLQSQTVCWNIQTQLPPSGKFWLRNVEQFDLLGVNYIFDERSLMMPLPEVSPTNNHLLHLELFAGGFGGWKSALDFVCSLTDAGQVRTIAVEHDVLIAQSYALTNHAGFLQLPDHVPLQFFADHHGDWIIRDDVLSPKWKASVSLQGVDVVTLSAPCPAWTGANESPGLNRADGALLLESVLECRFFRPSYIMVEQVANFAQHPHRSLITRAFHWIGYKIIFQRTINISQVLHNDRPRWFCIAKRVHAEVPEFPVPGWISTELNIPPTDAVFQCWPEETKTQLYLTPEALQVATNPNFTKVVGKTGLQLLHHRTYDQMDTNPTFMSMYGRQHELSEGYLAQHQFYGHYLRDPEAPHQARHWHPAEISLKHGLTNQCFHHDSLELSWTIQGNVVTAIQVLPLLVAWCNSTWETSLDIQAVTQRYLDECWTASEVGFQRLTHGFIMTQLSAPLPSTILQSYDDLISQIWQDPSATITWFPEEPHAQHSAVEGLQPTQVSPFTPTHTSPASTDMHDTAPFQVVLKGCVRFERNTQNFWFASNVSYADLVLPWDSDFVPHVSHHVEPGAPVVELMYDPDHISFRHTEDPMNLLMLIDQSLTILQIPRNLPVVDHQALEDIGLPYDQFGVIACHQRATERMIVMDEQLPPPAMTGQPVFLLAAYQSCKITWTWNPMSDTVLMGIMGDSPARQTIGDFWGGLMTSDGMRKLGRVLEVQCTPTQIVLLFRPASTDGVCPHKPFELVLAVLATRAIMNHAMQSVTFPAKTFQLHWSGSVLWYGKFPSDFSMHTIQQILFITLQPCEGKHKMIFQHGQNLIQDEEQWFDMYRSTPDELIILHLTPPLPVLRLVGGGGGPAKTQQRAYQQSALAAMLLEQGYELPWVSKSVDLLLDKYGLTKLQSITSQPMGGPRLRNLYSLLEDAKIEVPKPSKPVTTKPPPGAPWKPKKRRSEIPLDIEDYDLFPGYFCCEDGSAAIMLPAIRPQATGVCLASPASAIPWLQNGVQTSADELALVFPGPPPCDSRLPEDFDSDTWLDLVSKPFPTVKKLLQEDQLALQSMWGKSLRMGRAQASPTQATSLQIHGMVQNVKLDEFLRKSGYNKIFCTPKLPNGRLSTEFKVLWSDMDVSRAMCQSAAIPGCLGLVRGKTSVGYRVRASQFDKAWAVLHPGEAPPQKAMGNLVYKILGLPFGVTMTMMTRWLETLKWEACPFKAIGPSGYLVRQAHPPPGVHHFNGSPVLLQFLPDKDVQQAPVVVGPRSSPGTGSDPFQQPGGDPWAPMRPTATQPRVTTGPVAQRFQEQDEKISNLQADMQKLIKVQEHHKAESHQMIQSLEQRTGEQFAVVNQNLTTLQQEVDRTLKLSLQQNTQMMDSRMDELKQLLRSHSKRTHEPAEDSDMDSEH
eukprot:Skav220794  [mRNA]  locus=scaffold150:88279:92835:- [translate_table: standard]